MNRNQKISCFNLLITGLSLGASLGAVLILARLIGMPKAWAGMALMGLMGLIGFGPLIFRKQNDKDVVSFDERDLLIYKRSESTAYITTYAYFITFCAIVLNNIGINGQVPTYVLLIMPAGGLVVLMLAKAIALIIQYSRGVKS